MKENEPLKLSVSTKDSYVKMIKSTCSNTSYQYLQDLKVALNHNISRQVKDNIYLLELALMHKKMAQCRQKIMKNLRNTT